MNIALSMEIGQADGRATCHVDLLENADPLALGLLIHKIFLQLSAVDKLEDDVERLFHDSHAVEFDYVLIFEEPHDAGFSHLL